MLAVIASSRVPTTLCHFTPLWLPIVSFPAMPRMQAFTMFQFLFHSAHGFMVWFSPSGVSHSSFPFLPLGFIFFRIPCFSLPLATPVTFFSLRLVAVDTSVHASSLQHSLQRLVMFNQVHHSTARLVVE
jgi:hypothetical protein